MYMSGDNPNIGDGSITSLCPHTSGISKEGTFCLRELSSYQLPQTARHLTARGKLAIVTSLSAFDYFFDKSYIVIEIYI